jgi:hypothetical protein
MCDLVAPNTSFTFRRRKRPTKPNGDDDDDGDATDKEPDSQTMEPHLLPTPTSIPPPATQPLVAPPAPQPISDMTLDVGQIMNTHPPHPETPISEDMNKSVMPTYVA